MPAGPSSAASERVRASTAPLVAAYAARRGVPTTPDTDDRLMMAPRPRAVIEGVSPAMSSSGARTLTAWSRSINSASSSVTGRRAAAAALLTRMSTAPSSSSMAATTSPGASGSARSLTTTKGSWVSPAATSSSCGRVARHQRHPGAGRVEGAGDGGADPPRGPGHDCGALIQREGMHAGSVGVERRPPEYGRPGPNTGVRPVEPLPRRDPPPGPDQSHRVGKLTPHRGPLPPGATTRRAHRRGHARARRRSGRTLVAWTSPTAPCLTPKPAVWRACIADARGGRTAA